MHHRSSAGGAECDFAPAKDRMLDLYPEWEDFKEPSEEYYANGVGRCCV
jgi:hypothetical protein